MQVFIKRSDLSATPVPILAYYPDDPLVDRNFHGTDHAVLSIPPAGIIYDSDSRSNHLSASWRADYAVQVVNDEAGRRITESFPEFMQRNALRYNLHFTNISGANPTTWDPANKAVYDSAEAGWVYVAAVRSRADALETALPIDPTADANWPTRIGVIYVPPV